MISSLASIHFPSVPLLAKSACYFMPVSGLFPFLWFLTFKVFFILFTGSCLQIAHFFCKQTFVNKAQNILKVIFYSKGSSVISSIFIKPSPSFLGWIRFQER